MGIRSAKRPMHVYESLSDLVDVVDAAVKDPENTYAHERRAGWAEASWDQAVELSKTGWDELLPDTLALMDTAVAEIEHEDTRTSFLTEYTTAGADVDVGRYLSGEPECMVAYPLIEVPTEGRVVQITAGIFYSSGVNHDTVHRRGQVICALVLALQRRGLNAEVWAEGSAECGFSIRVCIKQANEVLDPSRLMYMFAHTSAFRQLMFAAHDHLHQCSCAWLNADPRKTRKDELPGGLYLPGVVGYGDVPDAPRMLRNLLTQVGIATSE